MRRRNEQKSEEEGWQLGIAPGVRDREGHTGR